MVAPEHPLTARVEVDRLWRSRVRQGLGAHPGELGQPGRVADPPEAARQAGARLHCFGLGPQGDVAPPWLCRRAFAGDSELLAEGAAQIDPENRLWSSGPRRRLSAEMLRDAALMHSGLLGAQARRAQREALPTGRIVAGEGGHQVSTEHRRRVVSTQPVHLLETHLAAALDDDLRCRQARCLRRAATGDQHAAAGAGAVE